MTPEQTHLWLQIQQRQMLALERMAANLDRITQALDRLAPQTAPNYQFPLESFKNFDWASIGFVFKSWIEYQIPRPIKYTSRDRCFK